MTLCGSSWGVFESKRTTCLRDKASPSICSTKQLPHCQSRTSCLLAKSWHHHVVVHLRAPGISSAPTLTTANLKARFARQSAPALTTACGSGAHSFAWASRGCVSSPAHRMLGRADGHGCRTCGPGRWPWRGTAAVINLPIDGPLVLAGPGPAALKFGSIRQSWGTR